MISFILCGLFIALFAFVDVWYFVRGIHFVLQRLLASIMGQRRQRKHTEEDIFRVSCVRGIVLPSDLDMMWHMNNSKYLRELDFGRFKLFSRLFYPTVRKLKGSFALNAISIRYRRSLLLWQWFTIESKVLCWKDDGMYLEQRFIGDGDKFVYAIALIKFVVRGEGLTMDIVMETAVTGEISSPPSPPEVKGWIESISSPVRG
uniref:Protein THEM6 n=1 Tax=Suberites domuncula TaxID=55567 RepID=Q70W29_SUBDO|nr:mesenchymal stem cell-like protein [Suberites domuncula]